MLLTAVMLMCMLAGCASPFGKKYDSASELFTDFNEVKEGSFLFSTVFEIKKEETTVKAEIVLDGMTDGTAAVCSYHTNFNFDGTDHAVDEPLVYIERVNDIRSGLMYALLDACGSEWVYENGSYICGTDDNSVSGGYFAYLADCADEAGAAELVSCLEEFVQEIRTDETRSVLNTSVSFKKGKFSEKINGSIIVEELQVDFTSEYSFEADTVSYNSDSEYVMLVTALAESFNDVYQVYGAEAGIYEEEETEITEHVVDGKSLIVQGLDENYYKLVWDGTAMNYSDGSLEYGEWSLALAGDSNVTVSFRMFPKNAEDLMNWYQNTYGDTMTVTSETEEITAGIGTVTHAAVTLSAEEEKLVNDMYLYQVSEAFQLQIIIQNPDKEYDDRELLDMALVSCTLYQEGKNE